MYGGLVLCAVILVVWFVGRWRGATLGFAGSKEACEIGLGQGRLHYSRVRGSLRRSIPWEGWHFTHDALPQPGWTWLPVRRDIGTISLLVLPLWIPFLVLALPTGWLFYLDRRAVPGHCPKCRYDLRGNTTTVCPECGHAVANNQA